MSNPSIIFHQGLRCTKVPRESRPTGTAVSSPESDSSPSNISSSNSAVTLSIDNSPGQTGLLSTAEPSPSPTETDSHQYSSGDVAQQSNTRSSGNAQSTGLITPSVLPGAQTLSGTTILTPNPTVTGEHGTTASSQSPHDPSDKSHTGHSDTDNGANTDGHGYGDGSSLGKILGSTLGSLIFLAVLLLICLFVLRRRRKIKRRTHGATERLLQSGRDSADSFASSAFHQRYQSGISIDSHSHLHLQSPLEPISSPTATVFPHSTPIAATSPINNMSEITPPPPAAAAAHPNNNNLYHTSTHTSQQSLGSTIILPGRSSSLLAGQGSSASLPGRDGDTERERELEFELERELELEREDYARARLSGPLRGRSDTVRFSSRSDPFDLEVPSTDF